MDKIPSVNSINEINDKRVISVIWPDAVCTLVRMSCESNTLTLYYSYEDSDRNLSTTYVNNYSLSLFEITDEIHDVKFKLVKNPVVVGMDGSRSIGYFSAELSKGSKRLNEGRIIIMGEKGVGKTCLARKLIDPTAPLTNEEESTPGIDISLWHLKEDKLNLRIWDFAGHTVTHAVHRFFLSERCIYILVYDSRSESRNRLEYWLNHVQIYGGNSQAYIFVNERDQHKANIAINTLKEDYNIVDLYTFNVEEDINKLEQFRQAISYHIKDNPSWEYKEIPKSHFQVKEALEALFNKKEQSNNAEFINKEEFDEIASQYEVDDPDTLLINLHQLGISLWYENMEAYNTLVLNPEWISEGVYQIINWVNNKQSYRLTLDSFKDVFESNLKRFPVDKHSFLFELIKEYELAYKSDNSTLIIPHLLNEDQPNKLPFFKMDESLMLKYVADLTLPSNTISRFIVRHHKQIKMENNKELVWRYGVILEDSLGGIALVRERDRSISVKGSNKTNFLKELRSTLNDIFESYKNKKPELTYRVKNYGENISSEIMQSKSLYLTEQQIQSYIISHRIYFDSNTLSEISLDQTAEEYAIKTNIRGRAPTLKIFLSYSHKDENYKDELDIHFAALKRSQKIKTWNDREIFAGQKWNDEIKKELSESNIILLLISADFIASNYIWEVEIKRALLRHNKGEARVIPIFCRPCDFEGMPFAQLQGLPKNTQPIKTFEDKDTAYLEIVNGIKKVIEDLTI